ncbi:AMP-binding protein [Terrarubrum flagellatum]|uniref:AMP-binding protein n=1 Tax=Terrirubrum flagellatum TaxID=2895980 RepID=UPI0031456403
MRPWRTHFPDAANWDAPVDRGVLPDLLGGSVRDWAERPAISFRATTISYRELGDLVDRAASGFLSIGICKGATVALYLPNTPWHPICFFALTKIGARVAHISALDAPREIAHKISDSGAIALVTTNWSNLLQQAMSHRKPGLRLVIGDDARWGGLSNAAPFELGDDVLSLDALLRDARVVDFLDVTPEDVALLQYTGGTTGLPKAAMLTHGNLVASVGMYRAWNDGLRPPPGEGRTLCVLPLFHIYALSTIMLRCIREGDELLLHARFDIESVLADIEQKRATSLAGVPTIWIAIANHPGIETRDFSSLLLPASGGAPMPFDMEQRVEKLVGRRLRLGWGMSETAPAGTRVPPTAEPRPGLIGVPYPNIDMRIVSLDDPAKPLPPDEMGEIAIRGANVFAGYWNQPEETRAAFVDGWFLTGDIGAMDEKGVFRILDRKKNMIISSGFNVYPTAIENALYDHPDVRECIVIGIADPYRGQAAKAFIALRSGAPEMTLAELQEFLATRVGRHEIPTALEIRAELPRSPAGKLLAKILIEEERAKAASPRRAS